MFKHYRQFIAYFLLVFLPIQAFSAGNMLVCRGLMETSSIVAVNTDSHVMPCHADETHHHAEHDQNKNNSSSCVLGCAHTCISMGAMFALIADGFTVTFLDNKQTPDITYSNYVSITLPNLQRPPISLI